MIKLGLDVNMHAGDFYIWYPPTSSILTNFLAEFIGHWLMNFHSPCHASLPLILIWHAMTQKRMRFYRRWRKVRMLIRLLDMIGASWQLYISQVQYETFALEKFRKGEMPHQPYHPTQARRSGWISVNDKRDKIIVKKLINFTWELRREPLRLADLPWISIRKAVRG